MQTKVEITIESGMVSCFEDGDSYDVIDGLVVVLARRISSDRLPGVTNEALADGVRKWIFEALERDGPKRLVKNDDGT